MSRWRAVGGKVYDSIEDVPPGVVVESVSEGSLPSKAKREFRACPSCLTEHGEVERLRAEVEEQAQLLGSAGSEMRDLCAERDELFRHYEELRHAWHTAKAERDRYRGALQEIASNHGNCDCNSAWNAIRALEEQPDGS